MHNFDSSIGGVVSKMLNAVMALVRNAWNFAFASICNPLICH